MTLTKTQRVIAAKILEMAAEEFGNHISNDLELDNTSDNLEFVKQMIADSDYPEDKPNISPGGGEIYVMDWQVMSYCKRLLLKE